MPFISTVRSTFGAQRPLGRIRIPRTSTGGSITTAGGYRIHTFTTVGNSTFTISSSESSTTIEYLIVGGGGAGGDDIGGGGGAGGLLTGTTSISNGSFTIVVGDGGASTQGTENTGRGLDGNNSSAFGFTALKGGAAGGEGESAGNGGNGTYGSGGGGGYNAT